MGAKGSGYQNILSSVLGGGGGVTRGLSGGLMCIRALRQDWKVQKFKFLG